MEKDRKIHPQQLEVVEHDGSYALFYGEEMIMCRGGKALIHTDRCLLDHLLRELDGQGGVKLLADGTLLTKGVTAYDFFGIRKCLEAHDETIKDEQFRLWLAGDPTLRTVPGPERFEQLFRFEPLRRFLTAHDLPLPDLVEFFDDREMWGDDYERMKEESLPPVTFSHTIGQLFERLSKDQQAVVVCLRQIHQGVVLFPMTLVLGRVTPTEYAMGVMAAHAFLTGTFRDVNSKAHRSAFRRYREGAEVALAYLKASGPALSEFLTVEEQVLAGESTFLEFKSTLRQNLKAAKQDEVMTHAVLKTIAAFLNSEGGTLMIGIADDGQVLGIESDGFPNDDKFLLHLVNKVKATMGDYAATCIDPQIHRVKDKAVCRVICFPSDTPVYVKHQNDQEFYVRTGPATTKVSTSEIYTYVSAHFRGR